MRNGKLSLRATFTIDIKTESFVDAGHHQTQLAALLETMRSFYPAATLDIREQRPRVTSAPDTPKFSAARTGNLRPYSGNA